MAICTDCGSASAPWARLCAACGRRFGEPGDRPPAAMGAGAIGDVAEVAPAGPGRWGSGVLYEPRGSGFAGLAAEWRPVLRALLAPTVLLLAAAVLPALPGPGLWPPDTGFGDRYRASLALVLTAFGAPLHSRSAGDADGLALASGTDLHLVPVLVAAGWLALLWRGLRTARRRGAAAGRAGAAGAAVRIATVSGAAVLLLGLFGRVRLAVSAVRPEMGHRVVGVELPVAVAVAAALAGVLALAVFDTGALRARAGRWPVLFGPAVRAAAAAVVPATVAAPLIAGLVWDAPAWVWLPLAANGGLLVLGRGSGATLRLGADDAVQDLSLFGTSGVGELWWAALLLAVAGAVVLGRSAYRMRLRGLDRLRLAALYAVLLSVPMLLAGVSLRDWFGPSPSGPAEGREHLYTLSLAAGTVVVANLLWAALGALGLPALFAAVRPVPVEQCAPPAPDAPPSTGVRTAEEPPAPPSPYRAEVLDRRRRD
ncbi:hypothetical protein [Kitasatospora sp. NPDC059571]|uniref:hypothetical protein n=1 Tax=Kitasatospora sp. NPDC059571 TaxID=3346871 RepID=UPI00367F28B5